MVLLFYLIYKYDNVWTYVVPLAITLLLYQCDIKKIWKESVKMLVIYLLSAIGTMAGAVVGFYFLASKIPFLAQVAGMMTGSYIGGGANFAANGIIFLCINNYTINQFL